MNGERSREILKGAVEGNKTNSYTEQKIKNCLEKASHKHTERRERDKEKERDRERRRRRREEW